MSKHLSRRSPAEAAGPAIACSATTSVAIVVIGRNEGERLRRSLASVLARAATVVYVDSGSTDASVAVARGEGIGVVELDTATSFSAGRARNEGFRHLRRELADVEYVQFLDGDCELINGWFEAALKCFARCPDVAIVCGDLEERFPEASLYNRLCSMEWKMLPGEVKHSGGIFMIRREAFEHVGGFNPAVIAGEEPELCVRLRKAGWKVLRIDHPMARHDADIHSFRRWWKRSLRNGHAVAEGYRMHGRGPARHCVKEHRSNWLWGLALPLAAAGLALPTYGGSLVLLGLYPLQIARIARYRMRVFRDLAKDAWLYALFTMIGKTPGMLGQTRYWLSRCRGVSPGLIEYKIHCPNTQHRITP